MNIRERVDEYKLGDHEASGPRANGVAARSGIFDASGRFTLNMLRRYAKCRSTNIVARIARNASRFFTALLPIRKYSARVAVPGPPGVSCPVSPAQALKCPLRGGAAAGPALDPVLALARAAAIEATIYPGRFVRGVGDGFGLPRLHACSQGSYASPRCPGKLGHPATGRPDDRWRGGFLH
jgi:hypothetical protein